MARQVMVRQGVAQPVEPAQRVDVIVVMPQQVQGWQAMDCHDVQRDQ